MSSSQNPNPSPDLDIWQQIKAVPQAEKKALTKYLKKKAKETTKAEKLDMDLAAAMIQHKNKHITERATHQFKAMKFEGQKLVHEGMAKERRETKALNLAEMRRAALEEMEAAPPARRRGAPRQFVSAYAVREPESEEEEEEAPPFVSASDAMRQVDSEEANQAQASADDAKPGGPPADAKDGKDASGVSSPMTDLTGSMSSLSGLSGPPQPPAPLSTANKASGPPQPPAPLSTAKKAMFDNMRSTKVVAGETRQCPCCRSDFKLNQYVRVGPKCARGCMMCEKCAVDIFDRHEKAMAIPSGEQREKAFPNWIKMLDCPSCRVNSLERPEPSATKPAATKPAATKPAATKPAAPKPAETGSSSSSSSQAMDTTA